MGRRGKRSYRGDKRKKELKRLARKDAKRRRRHDKDQDSTDVELLGMEGWLQQLVNLQRGGQIEGEETLPSVDAGAPVPFLMNIEELEVLRTVANAVPIRWREENVKVKNGDEVKLHFKGTFDDGREFSSSLGKEPVSFTVGQGQVIKGIENAVMGMEAGESRTVKIPCDEAYGQRREELVAEVPRSELPENVDPRPGLKLKLIQPGGVPVVVLITDVGEDTVTLDGNHPLAGRDLTFELELIAVG